jgi:hypothetical protein
MNVTVRCCPNCGRIVNASIPIGRCLAERHATARRSGYSYCMNCGAKLAQDATVAQEGRPHPRA